jgi:hypothetical protein
VRALEALIAELEGGVAGFAFCKRHGGHLYGAFALQAGRPHYYLEQCLWRNLPRSG